MAGLFDDLLVEDKPDLPVIPSGALRPTTYGPGSPNPTPADLKERIGHADNPLKEGDVALQPETAKQYGLKTGDKFVYQGQVFNYADTPAPRVGKVIDVYHPSPTASPKGGSTGLFSDIITPTPTPSETPEPAKNAGMFQDIVDDADADRTPPPINIPQSTPSAVPSPDEALGPHEPSWIEKTGNAVAKYARGMVPTSGEQVQQMAHLDFSQPEDLARLIAPPAGMAMDLIKQTQTRITEIQNADQTPAYSQERFDAGVATALDLLGIGGGIEGGIAMARRGLKPPPNAQGPAVPPPPGTAGAAPPPMPNAAVGPQVAPPQGGPIPIVTAAEREGIMYGGESKGLTPDDLAALDEVAPPPPIVPGEPPTVPPNAPTVPEPAPAAAPRRPTEKAVTMKVRPLQQLRRQLAAAEKAGEAGFRRGSREARQQAEQAAAIEARMVKDTVNTVDNWMAQDVEDLRKSLISFSRHLPLHERGKFIPAITKAIKKPAIYSKDPGVLQRRAASLMDRMTEAIYQQNKREVQGKIGKLLQKIEDSPSIILSQKRITQQIRRTFENLKDKMSLEMLERMLSNLKWQEAHGRDLFHLSKTIEDQRREFAIGEIEAQGTRKSDTPQQALLPLGDVETMWQRATAAMARDKHKIQRFQMAIKPMDWVFQLFDQRQWGKLWEHMKAPVDIQYGQFLDTADVYKKRLTSILDKYKLNEGNLRRIYAHAEYRQDGGEANLKARGYTNADIAKIKNVGQLSKAERAYLRESDKILNEMYPAIKDVLEKFYNQELPNVPNYFPRIRDWDHYNSLSIEEGKFAEAYRRTNTKDGFTKERQGAVTKNLDNAHEVMMNHIDDAVYHMTMGPTIKRIANIVGDDRFKNVAGSFGQQLFADYVDVLARNGGEGSGRRIGWMDTLRKNMGVAQLAFRLTTTFLQPTQLIQALPYLGKANLARTLSEFGSRANQEWILKNFPEVKHRMTDDPAGMGYTRKTIRDRAARAGFHLISDWDRKAAMAVAETAYRDALERRGITFDRTAALHMQAYAEAMNIVRKTQASPFTKDVPLALSGGKFAGNKSLNQAIFQFQNFTMNRWAMIEGDALQMGIKDKNWRRAAKVTSWLIVATAAEQMLREGIANGLRTILGTTDSEQQRLSADQEKSAAQLILERGATDLAFTMPILSNAAGMYRYDSSGVPIADTLMDVVKGARSFFRGKKGETKAAGAIRLAQGVGGATGLPTGQAGDILSRLIRGTANVQQGPTEGFYPLAPAPDIAAPPPPPPPAY